MSDWAALALVVAVIYGWECIFWMRQGVAAFASYWGGSWRLIHPAAFLGNQSGGLVVANPLPPLGTLFAAGRMPLSISPEGLLSYVAGSLHPGGRDFQTANFFRFESIQRIEAAGKTIRLNGRVLVNTGSTTLARSLAEKIKRLHRMDREKRSEAFAKELRASMDTKAVKQRVEEFNERARNLRRISNALFAYLFLVVPPVIWHAGIHYTWIPLLIVLLGFTGSLATLFMRHHRKLYPEDEDERFTHFCLILLSPATAVRALDALSMPLLEAFHPLAVASVLLPKEKYLAFARLVLIGLRHPPLAVCPSNDPVILQTELYARNAMVGAVEQFLEGEKVDLGELTRPPKPADSTCIAFCPRCEAQFTSVTGTCIDCGGLPLIPFGRTEDSPTK